MSSRSPDAPPDAPPPRRSHRALDTLRRHVRPGSFPLLLAASLALYGLNGVATALPGALILAQVARASVVGACLYVLSASRLTLYLGLAVAGIIAGFDAHLWPVAPRAGRLVQDALTIAFQLWVFGIVLREVFRRETSERDAVIGALAGFLLLVMVFMRIHALLEALTPGSYFAQGPPLAERTAADLEATFQYFSTITLTTVGFGDIVAVAPAARLVTGLEAIVGQLYLAVVVATLVARVAAGRH